MDQTRRRFVLLVACLLGPQPYDTFVLRKRSVQDLDFVSSLPQSGYFDSDQTAVSEQQLADALRVIQLARQQNHLSDDDDDEDDEEQGQTPILNPYYRTPNEYRNFNEDDDRIPDEVDPDFEDDPAEDLADNWNLEDDAGGNDDDGDDSSDLEKIQEIISSATTGEADREKQSVNKSELEDLFSPAKESPPVDADSGGTLEVDKKAELSKTDVAKLLDQTGDATDMREVLQNEADKIEAKETALENAQGAPKVEVTKVVSVEDVDKSNGDGGEGKLEKATMDVKAVESWPNKDETVSKEWLIDLVEPNEEYTDSGRSRKLFKRSEPSLLPLPPLQISDNLEDEVEEEETKKGQAVELLKAYIELQDEENRHLAKALNLATMSQVERTDRYIPQQIDQLKMAVHDEQAMQAIREIIRTEDDTDDDPDDELDAAEYVKRRMDSISPEENAMMMPQIYDGDYEEDAEEDDEEGDEHTELSDAELAERLLKAKLRQYLLETVAAESADDDDDQGTISDELSPRSWEDVEQLNNYAAGEPVYNPFLRDIVQGHYHPRTSVDKRYSRPGDEEDAEEDDEEDSNLEYRPFINDNTDLSNLLQGPDDDVCPAVDELTNDCLKARDNGLVLDDEAIDLCNRHQLCYSCGDVFGLSPDRCDGGYLGEAEQLCRGDARCKNEAAGLYLIMVDHHTYVPAGYTVASCRRTCTRDFIIGDTSANKRR